VRESPLSIEVRFDKARVKLAPEHIKALRATSVPVIDSGAVTATTSAGISESALSSLKGTAAVPPVLAVIFRTSKRETGACVSVKGRQLSSLMFSFLPDP